jgi:hypothetical protein
MNKIIYFLLATAIAAALVFGLKDTHQKGVTEKNLKAIQELKAEYTDQIVPDAKEGVHTDDVFITQHFKDIFRTNVDEAVNDYMIRSSKIYLDICAVGEKNYKNEEVMNSVFEQTSEILKEQMEFLSKYASYDNLKSALKIISEEQEKTDQLHDLENNYLLEEAMKSLDSAGKVKPTKNYK